MSLLPLISAFIAGVVSALPKRSRSQEELTFFSIYEVAVINGLNSKELKEKYLLESLQNSS